MLENGLSVQELRDMEEDLLKKISKGEAALTVLNNILGLGDSKKPDVSNADAKRAKELYPKLIQSLEKSKLLLQEVRLRLPGHKLVLNTDNLVINAGKPTIPMNRV